MASPTTKAFSLSLENQNLRKKLELLGGTNAAELLDLNSENQQVIADQQSEIARLTAALAENSTNTQALNQFKDEAEHKITSTIAAQRSRLEDLEKENADLRSSLSMKTSQLESVTESQSSLQESNDSKDKVIMSLKTQISGFESKIKTDTEANEEIGVKTASEISSLKLKLSLQESAVQELMDSNVQLVEEKNSSNRSLQENLSTLKSKLEETELERDALLADMDELKENVLKASGTEKSTVKELKAKNSSLSEANDKLARRVKKLETALDKTKAGGEDLKVELGKQEEYIKNQLERAKKLRNVLRDTNMANPNKV
mmetsp:Transcript_1986/g.3996  ORF Transcript_1986/g.3996 Transcript_1986/m.3996 type:complete len:317 (-) Transcript_1986:8-958(-)